MVIKPLCWLLPLSVLCVNLSVWGQDQSDTVTGCGTLFSPGQYGPYDFRTDKEQIKIVLGAHFTPEVEALVRGKTGTTAGGDIDYTLRAIPNNPRALLAMVRLGEKEKTQQPRGSRYTLDCWFERAIRFRPDDQIVRMLYITYLTTSNRKADAMQQLEFIVKSAKDNAFTYQNVGLLYFDLGEHQLALAQAHKAIELGLNRPDLRDKLQAIGKWVEPTPAESASAPAKP